MAPPKSAPDESKLSRPPLPAVRLKCDLDCCDLRLDPERLTNPDPTTSSTSTPEPDAGTVAGVSLAPLLLPVQLATTPAHVNKRRMNDDADLDFRFVLALVVGFEEEEEDKF